jgi:tetratricopeptide (TPR) repeat protein
VVVCKPLPARRITNEVSTKTVTILSTCFILLVVSGSCRQTKGTPRPNQAAHDQSNAAGDRDQFGILPPTVQGFPVSRGAVAGYVDDRACKECHEQLFESYQSVGMSQSFYPADPKQAPEGLDKPYYHAASQRYYLMTERDDKLVLKRYCQDAEGQQFAEFESEVAWVMGSGNHGRTYISQSKHGELTMLPLAWYAEAGWRMAPGYDNSQHPRFERIIDRACMFCHNAYPEIPVGADMPHKDDRYPPQLPHGIGCQRCHGPGARHIESALDANSSDKVTRERIINPANFTPQQRDDLCMTCHLQPEVGIGGMMPRAFDKPVFSHRPGDALKEFITFLEHGTKAERGERFQINHHAYRLRQSKCHEASGGELTCLSCHDPHRKVAVLERPAYYRAKCLQCHQLKDCQHEEMGHGRDPAQSDCISCHMTKARPSDVIHATTTDHLIRRKPASRDLTAPRNETPTNAKVGQITPYFKTDPSSPRFETYAGFIKTATNPAAAERWLKAFEASGPHPVAGYVQVGRGLLEAKDASRAITLLQEGLRKFPKEPEVHWTLGTALLSRGDVDGALKALQLARNLDPASPGIAASLADAYLKAGALTNARRQYEAAIASRPTNWKSWQQYGYVLQQLKDSKAAQQAYRRAIALNPDDFYSYRAIGTLYEADKNWQAMFKIFEQGATRNLDLNLHLVMCWMFAPDTRVQQPGRALVRARKLSIDYADNPRTHLHHALALYNARSAAGFSAAIAQAQALGADQVSCLGLELLGSLLRNERQKSQGLLAQFERARQAPTTEPLRRIIENLVQKTLVPRQPR